MIGILVSFVFTFTLLDTPYAYAATAPSAVQSLAVASKASGIVNLSWLSPVDAGSGLSDFVVEHSLDRTTWTRFDDGVSTNLSASVTGLDRTKFYFFRVAAVSDDAVGPWVLTPNKLPKVYSGREHVYTVLSNNSVIGWGRNSENALQFDGTTSKSSPVSVGVTNNLQEIFNGLAHQCLLSSGSLSCWGWNSFGQTGSGSTGSPRTPPGQVSGLSGTVIKAGLGWQHSCAVLSTGTVRCWGWNTSGQIGDGTTGTRLTATQVPSLTDVVDVAAGFEHTCALTSTNGGEVFCWGRNTEGQVGDGTLVNRPLPVKVQGLSGVKQLRANGNFNCAVLSDDSVKCWGHGTNGQLGNNALVNSTIPVSVFGLGNVKALALGDYFACALINDGSVTCWGHNAEGQLGNGTTTSSPVPTDVAGIRNVDNISAGGGSACAVTQTATVLCWGFNSSFGQLGIGSLVNQTRPTAIIVSPVAPYSQAVAPVGMPAAPVLSSATTSSSTSVSLAWTAPDNGGRDISDYLVQYSSDSGANWITFADGVGTGTTANVTSLTRGISYQFRVSAINSEGTSTASSVLTSETKFVPTAPRSVSITAKTKNSLSLTWLAPTDDGAVVSGGGSVTDYKIETSVDGTAWTVFEDGVGTTLSSTITGLTRGANYQVRVNAINSLGAGATALAVPISAGMNIPAELPVAPTGFTVSNRLQTGLTLNWQSTDNGGRAPTDFLVQYKAVDGGWLTFPHAASNATSIAITGLTKGNEYQFRVAAVTPEGTGPYGTMDGSTVSASSPSPVRGLTLSAKSSTTASLSWTAPDDNGGRPILDYLVEHSSNGSTWVVFEDIVSTETSAVVTGLSRGTTYSFRVRAINSIGTSQVAATQTPISVEAFALGTTSIPNRSTTQYSRCHVGTATQLYGSWGTGRPFNLVCPLDYFMTRFTGTVTLQSGVTRAVTFTASSDDGVHLVVNGATVLSDWRALAGDRTGSFVMTPGVEYPIEMWHYEAQAGAGVGLYWNANGTTELIPESAFTGETSVIRNVVPATVSAAPSISVVSKTSNSVSLSWATPDNGGRAISDYVVQFSVNSGSTWTTFTDAVSTATSTTVTGLTRGTPYVFRVAAINPEGTGAYSPSSAEVIPALVPAAPSGLALTGKTETSLSISWTAPDNGGRTITDYVVEYSIDQSNWTTFNDGVSANLTANITGLVKGTPYQIRVKAINDQGTGLAASLWSMPANLTNLIDVGQGEHSCAVLSTSSVMCWGMNSEGQLGDGTVTARNSPVSVSGNLQAIGISTGHYHSCAVTQNRTVQCWGENGRGQLGNGTTNPSNTPVNVSGLTNVASVSLGRDRSCALIQDGTVRCWGLNDVGQLGDGSITNRTTPVSVSGLTGVISLSLGDDHSCALLTGNTVRCWGLNSSGQLGDTSITSRRTSVPVSGLSNVASISTGSSHSCAVLTTGFVRCWGWNGSGQLGDSTELQRNAPVSVPALSGIKSISTGSSHTCAVDSVGSLTCWGENGFGQLGNGSTSPSYTPQSVTGLLGAVDIFLGGNRSCALLSDGSLKCWGQNSRGQLGDGSDSQRVLPVTVSGLTDATNISAGSSHACATLGDGTVECWGQNSNGQLGDGTNVSRSAPDLVPGLGGVTSVSVGGDTTCALMQNGTLRCWGANWTQNNTTPEPIIELSSVTDVKSTPSHSCALLANGTVKCWGFNGEGQLGDGTKTNKDVPTLVSNLSNAASISLNYGHSCAVLNDGTVKCWGTNNQGQLGDGTTTERTSPVLVNGLTGVSSIALGASHTCASLTSGTVKCWGAGGNGQLGNGGDQNSTAPVSVSGITDAASISSGAEHSCAVLTNGTVKCWGSNIYGQGGDGTNGDRTVPVLVSSLSNVETIDLGDNFSCAQLTDGSARCWGLNEFGQLGDGTDSQRYSPTSVLNLNLSTFSVPASAPSAPTTPSQTSKTATTATISWTAPTDNGGRAITDYLIQFSADGGTNWTTFSDSVSTVTSVTVTGLTRGTSYLFRVAAANPEGTGSYSEASVAVIPAVVPAVPTSLALTSKTATSLSLSWTAPTNNGGRELTDYSVEFSTDGINWNTFNDGTSTTTSATITGLSRGTTYQVRIKAVNPEGSSAATTLASLIPAVKAGPITNISLTSKTANSASISWTAPTDNGGRAITDYVIQYATEITENTVWTTVSDGVSATTSSMIGSLTRGTPFFFRVATVTAEGESSYLELTGSVIPAVPPSAPTGLILTDKTETSLSISWIAPTDNGGRAITDYIVEYSTNGTNWTTFNDGTSATTSAIITGLTRSQSYQVRVKASNPEGDSSAAVSKTSGDFSFGVISTGDSHACAIVAGGTVKCWGANDNGQLGDGTTNPQSSAISVLGITPANPAVSIDAGSSHTCVILADGTVQCWGANGNAQLGDGTTTQRNIPTTVSGISAANRAVSIGAGSSHTCAVLANGTVQCWGINTVATMGRSSTTPLTVPGITSANSAKSIAVGSIHACALLADGTIRCWGHNENAQMGNGTRFFSQSTPTTVSGITSATPAVSISAGSMHTCALISGGTIKCWGSNFSGKLGDGTSSDRTTPVNVLGISSTNPVKSVTGGGNHTCALLADGKVMCWGANSVFQLGDGTSTNRNIPVNVSGVSATNPAVFVSAGGQFNCVLLTDGTVECWGDNVAGQIGNGTRNLQGNPAKVGDVFLQNEFTLGFVPASAPVAPAPPSQTSKSATSATFTWSTPDDGGRAIYDYVIQFSADTGTTWTTFTDSVSTATSTNVTGLTRGTSYLFRVAAINPEGTSPFSPASAEVIPSVVPGAPTSLANSSKTATSLSLTWTAPADNGGRVLTDYSVEFSTDGTNWTMFNDGTSTNTYVTITGLTRGTAYQVRIKAVNPEGSSVATTLTSLIPAVKAGLARNLSLTSKTANSASISWTAPTDDGGRAITDYLIESSADGGTTWTTFSDSVSPATSATVTGLTRGTSYLFRVAAVNPEGAGLYSLASPAVIPAVVPATPTSLALTSKTATSLSLSWSAPTDNGGRELTDYSVEFSTDGTNWTTFADGTSTTTSATVTGLTRGTTYQVRIKAVNPEGLSPATTLTSLIPAVKAGPVTNIALSSKTATSATLSWTAPADNGGREITDYVIQYATEITENTVWTTVSDGVSVTTFSTIGSLTRGTPYFFRVATITPEGESSYLELTGSVIPAVLPSAPTGLNLTGKTETSLSIAWTAPDNGGRAITDYIVEHSINGTNWTTFNDGTSATASVTITGLTRSQSYQVRVKARTVEGDSNWGTMAGVVPGLVPTTPSEIVAAIASATSISLRWIPPSSDGGRFITDYVIQVSTNGGTTWTTYSDSVSTATNATLTGLTRGLTYSVRIAAVNTDGLSDYGVMTGTVIPSVVPGIPTNLAAPSKTSTSVNLSWTAPDNGGQAILDYIVEYSTDGTVWTTFEDGQANLTTATVTGLTRGTAYTFRVKAQNAIGAGPSGSLTASSSSSTLRMTTYNTNVVGAPVIGGTYSTCRSLFAVSSINFVWSSAVVSGCPADRFMSKFEGTIRLPQGVPSQAVRFYSTVDDGAALRFNQEAIPTSWVQSTGGRVLLGGADMQVGVAYPFELWHFDLSGPSSLAFEWEINGVVSVVPAEAFTTISSSSVTPAVLPAIPSPSVSSKTANSVTLNWSEPDNGGRGIADYVVQYSANSGSTWTSFLDGASSVTSTTVTGLTRGTPYVFRVAAVNAEGASPYSSATASVIPSVTPAAPGSLALIGKTADSLSVSWTTPDNGGMEISDYVVETSTNGTTWATFDDGVSTVTTATVTGLTRGTSYQIRVRAQNVEGLGTGAILSSLIPAVRPGSVSNIEIAAKTGTSVSLEWSAPADNGGRAITDYLIQFSSDAGINWTTFSDGISSANSAVVSGLSTNTIYLFRVAAVSPEGASNYLQRTGSVEAVGVPSAPTALVSTGKTATSLSLSWTPPNDSGGRALTDYVVEYSSDETTWTVFDDGVSVGTSVTVTGLTRGTSYQIRVKAVNSEGSSIPVRTSAPLRIKTFSVGSAVLPVRSGSTYTLCNTSPISDVNFEWGSNAVGQNCPADEVLSQITGSIRLPSGVSSRTVNFYASHDDGYYMSIGGTNVISNWVGQGATTYNSMGSLAMQASTIYDFEAWHFDSGSLATLKLYWDASGSIQLVPSTAFVSNAEFTPAVIPGAVSNLVLVSKSATSASISWAAPSDNGGQAITDYVIQFSTNSGSTWSTFADPISTATTATITGLTRGATHQIRIRPVNAEGPSTSTSPTLTVIPAVVPGSPTALSLTGKTGTSLSLSWIAPADNGGRVVTDYSIEHSADGSNWTTFNDGTSITTSATITGLMRGSTYQVRVRAISAEGSSPAITLTSLVPAVKPGPVSLVEASPRTADTRTLQWMAPSDNGGQEISNYEVRYTNDFGISWTPIVRTASISNPRIVAVPLNSENLMFQVRTNTPTGNGDWSDPSLLVSNKNATSFEIKWHAPVTNLIDVAEYVVETSMNDGSSWTTVRSELPTARQTTVTGLTRGTTYKVRVSAVDDEQNTITEYVSTVVPAVKPTEPIEVMVEERNVTSVSLSWSAPVDNGGRSITGYAVQRSTDNGATWNQATISQANATDTSAVVTGLTKNTTYLFRVAALTPEILAPSDGVYSTATGESRTATLPNAPTTPTTFVTSGTSISLSWSSGSDAGAPNIDYKIEYSTDGGTAWVLFDDGFDANVNKSVTGLTQGFTYVFRVWGVNIEGEGVKSAQSESAIAASVPSAPVAPIVTAQTSSTIGIAWEEPGNGGRAITSYAIQWSNNNGLTWSNASLQPRTATSTSATIVGLSNGTSYRFRVAAINPQGQGSYSPSSLNAIAGNYPSSVVNLRQTSNTGSSITLSFGSASSAIGSILSYETQYSVDGNTWATCSGGTCGTTSTSVTVPSLRSGTGYYLRVRASNSVGWGPYVQIQGATRGITPQTFVILTSDGQPITGGSVSWALSDGTGASSSPRSLNSAGQASFELVTTGPATITLQNGVLPSGATVSGSWSGVLGVANLELRVSAEPQLTQKSVWVMLPNEVPVPNSQVNALTQLSRSRTVSGFTFIAPGTLNAVTNGEGQATLTGYASGYPSALISYDDTVLVQRINTILVSESTEIYLEFMPWVSAPEVDKTVDYGAADVIEFTANAVPESDQVGGLVAQVSQFFTSLFVQNASDTVSALVQPGVLVAIEPPAGAPAAPASCGQVLSARTNSQGVATLRICPTSTGEYKVVTAGAVASKPLRYFVNAPYVPPVAVPYTPPAPAAAPAPAPAAAPAPAPAAAPQLGLKAKVSAGAVAAQLGIAVPPKAKVTLKVSGSSKKFCKVSGGKLVTLKPGNCVVSVTVQPAKQKGMKKKPAAIKVTRAIPIK